MEKKRKDYLEYKEAQSLDKNAMSDGQSLSQTQKSLISWNANSLVSNIKTKATTVGFSNTCNGKLKPKSLDRQ